MNWEAIGAVSDLISAIAVIVTLIYLAIQIHQNNALMAAELRATIVTLNTGLWTTVVEEPDVAQIAIKDRSGGQLTTEEEFRLNAVWVRALYNAEYTFEESPETFRAEQWQRAFRTYGTLRRAWSGGGPGSVLAGKDLYSTRFVEFMETKVSLQ